LLDTCVNHQGTLTAAESNKAACTAHIQPHPQGACYVPAAQVA